MSDTKDARDQLLTPEQQQLVANGGCIDDYEILRPIGKGKFSVVYWAKRRRDDLAVAMKKISIDTMDEKAREKTLKEVRLLKAISHPNIIMNHDSFLNGNELIIVLEWAEAGDLKRQIRKANERNIPFEERVIWKYFSQIADALCHMHERRIMHRDLKPANIFLTLNGTVKVGDLGLSRMLSDNTMEAHSKVGTPLYMSPEVLQGKGYDFKSDIWSLGCILYELAMLRSPFKSEGLNLYGLFQKISKGEYEPVRDTFSVELRDLCHQMLSLDSKQRPTVEEVAGKARAYRKAFRGKLRRPSSTSGSGSSQDIRSRPSSGGSLLSTVRPGSALASREVSQGGPGEGNSETLIAVRKPPSHPVESLEGPNFDELLDMEFVADRLQVLGYQDGYNGKYKVSCISRYYFLREAASLPRREKFYEFINLALWALQLSGHETFEVSDEEAPLKLCAQLLVNLEKAGVPSADFAGITSASLVSGSGPQVCRVLRLLLTSQSSTPRLLRPSYPLIEYQEDAQIDDNAGEEISEAEEEEECLYEEEAYDFHMNPSEWRNEVERVSSRLSRSATGIASTAVINQGPSWMSRMANVQGHAIALGIESHQTAPSVNKDSFKALQLLEQSVFKDIVAIEKRERYISRSLPGLALEHAESRQRHQVLRAKLEAKASVRSQLSSQLSVLMDDLATMKEKLQSKTDSLSGQGDSVLKLKLAIKDLRGTGRTSEVQLGLLRHSLMRKQLQTQTELRKRESRKPRKEDKDNQKED